MWIASLAVLLALPPVVPVPPIDVLLPASEASGMAASRRYPNVYYWLRDGGPATPATPRAALWSLSLDAQGRPQPVRGREMFPFYLAPGLPNVDWEALTIDDDGSVWVGDIGANDCVKDQRLYRFAEPDPYETVVLELEATYSLRFPDNPRAGCTTYNAEAMLWLDGHLYLFAKAHDSPVYRVDLPPSMAGEARLVRLGALGRGVNNISVGSLADDRSRFVVADHKNAWVYQSSDPALCGDAYLRDVIARPAVGQVRFTPSGAAVEGGTFVRDSYDIAFVAEDRRIYYVPGSSMTGSPKNLENPRDPPASVDRYCDVEEEPACHVSSRPNCPHGTERPSAWPAGCTAAGCSSRSPS